MTVGSSNYVPPDHGAFATVAADPLRIYVGDCRA